MSKPFLVLLPGFLSNEICWAHQIAHLGDIANVKVIPLLTENSAEKMCQKVLDQIEGPFALAGHSIGGWIALEIARLAPDRVTKLCALNTMARPDTPDIFANREKRIAAVESGGFNDFVAELVEYFVINKMVKPAVAHMFLSVGPKAVISQQQAMLTRQASVEALTTIRCPTLVIAAQKDPYFSVAMHQEMVDAIPHSKLAIVDDSGHMSPMEMPQAVTTLMRYWLNYF